MTTSGLNNLHTLTALTGRDANRHRTVIIQGFEASRTTFIVGGVLAVPVLLVTAVAWSIIGYYAVLVGAGVAGAGWWLLATRSRKGLQRRTFETLLDRKRSDAGQFYMCGRVIDPELNELGTVVASTVPTPAAPSTSGLAAAAPQPVTGAAAAGPVPRPVAARAMASAAAGFDSGDLFGGSR